MFRAVPVTFQFELGKTRESEPTLRLPPDSRYALKSATVSKWTVIQRSPWEPSGNR